LISTILLAWEPRDVALRGCTLGDGVLEASLSPLREYRRPRDERPSLFLSVSLPDLSNELRGELPEAMLPARDELRAVVEKRFKPAARTRLLRKLFGGGLGAEDALEPVTFATRPRGPECPDEVVVADPDPMLRGDVDRRFVCVGVCDFVR